MNEFEGLTHEQLCDEIRFARRLYDRLRAEKRFEAAKAAMQGLLSRDGFPRLPPQTVAHTAVQLADALLEELKK